MILTQISVLVINFAAAWYLPGSAPTEYERGSVVKIDANSLNSVKTQLPIDYYSLPFCRPSTIEKSSEGLWGDQIQSTPFEVKMLEESICHQMCSRELDDLDIETLKNKIDDEYLVHLLADDMPGVVRYGSESWEEIYYQRGYPLGKKIGDEGNTYLVYNHITIYLKYHAYDLLSEKPKYRVVGFEIDPLTVNHIWNDKSSQYDCSADSGESITSFTKSKQLTFTYDVIWVESPIKWATRWDALSSYSKEDSDIHWFSILNSFIVVLFLTTIVAMILLRTLLKDIASYNSIDDDSQEETGWKLVHADVFRRPQYSRLLAAWTGTGIQLLGMTVTTILLTMLGLIVPQGRGTLLQAMIVFFALMGLPAGYVAARFSKLLQKEEHARSLSVTFLTAVLFPGVCFIVFFIINFALWKNNSTGAVSFPTLLILLLIWFGISVPAVYFGAFYGYKKEPLTLPVRTHQIPREIPPANKCLNHPLIMCFSGGLLPFVAVFSELIFILTSIWQQEFYFLFGFLFVVILILIVTCGEISITFTYFQLTAEDYRWWWRSFFYSGTSALYVFLFSCFFVTRMDFSKPVTIFMYILYISLLSYGFFLLTGSIGFICSFFFVRAIYGSIKVD